MEFFTLSYVSVSMNVQSLVFSNLSPIINFVSLTMFLHSTVLVKNSVGEQSWAMFQLPENYLYIEYRAFGSSFHVYVYGW